MIEFFQSRARSFRCAFAGLWFVMRTQRNAWIHLIATVMVALLSFWLRIPARDWAVIVVAVAMVWTIGVRQHCPGSDHRPRLSRSERSGDER